MTRTEYGALLCGMALLGFAQSGGASGGGFATRDLNPILQPIYLPTLATFNDRNGWQIDQSLYITNTMQEESKGNESLLIDVENYRYELALRFRHEQWLARVDVPMISNSGGELDGLIEDWHDFFGFSNGDRSDHPQDQINIGYGRDGAVEYRQDSSSSGLADISLAIGYQAQNGTAWFAGIELPTGSTDDFSGNEAIDVALWLSRQWQLDEEVGSFALLGVSFPGDGDDYLESLVVNEIWVAQLGMDYLINPSVIVTAQLDMHSRTIEDSDLTAFGNSLQLLLGVGFPELFPYHRLDLFFTEDILVGSAPDFSFGIRLSGRYD
ncbi:MAG: DUF3187 family protein [Gammaproteobacteria bacterium]|nr:DUF3187 family protein [Gammaproteobacteria bacterium]